MAEINYQEIFGKKLLFNEVEEVAGEEVVELTPGSMEVIEKYQKLLDDNKTFEFVFSAVTKKSSLFTYENGVRIMLPTSVMNDELREKVTKGRTSAGAELGKPIKVKVSSIRRDGEYGAIVFLRNNFRVGSSADEDRWKARRAIDKMIAAGDKTKVPAKVVYVDKVRRIIALDIGGYGIKAYCKGVDWGISGATEAGISSVETGAVVGVSVVGKPVRTNADGIPVNRLKAGAYRCVKKSEVPYKGVASRFPEGTVVVARLVKRKDAYGFYAIEGFNDVNVLCFHPWLRDGEYKNASGVTEVVEGAAYRICITEVDEAKSIFRGRIVSSI